PQLIGEARSSLVSSAVPCLNPIRLCARARALSQCPSTSTSARAWSATRRASARKVMNSRAAAGIAYRAIAAWAGLTEDSGGAEWTPLLLTVGAIGAGVATVTAMGTVNDVTGVEVRWNRAGASTFQLGRITGATAMMMSARRPM